MHITDKSVIGLRFRMSNSRGQVLENIMDAPPLYCIYGSGRILNALESELLGMEAGQEKTIHLSEHGGYEGLDDEFYVEVVIDEVRAATEEELINGLTFYKTEEVDCDADCSCHR